MKSIWFFLLLTFITSQLHARNRTIIDLVDTNSNFVSHDDIELAIQDHSKGTGSRNGTYLSLGETHRYQQRSLDIAEGMANLYLKNRPRRSRTRLCSENIDHYFKTNLYQYWKKNVTQSLVFYGNNQLRTDFKNCSSNRKSNKDRFLIYSGFYHQYPLGNIFNDEHKQTPVLTDKNNNIKSQMGRSHGLFISQIDVDFLAQNYTRHFLRQKFNSFDDFKLEFRASSKKLSILKSRMQEIPTDKLRNERTFGVYLNKVNFRDPIIKKRLPVNAFILLTEGDSRLNLTNFFLLEKISNLPNKVINGFINLLALVKRHYVAFSQFEKDAQGNQTQTGYGSLAENFNSGTQFLQLSLPKTNKSYLVTADPTVDQLRCFNLKVEAKNEVDCKVLFTQY